KPKKRKVEQTEPPQEEFQELSQDVYTLHPSLLASPQQHYKTEPLLVTPDDLNPDVAQNAGYHYDPNLQDPTQYSDQVHHLLQDPKFPKLSIDTYDPNK